MDYNQETVSAFDRNAAVYAEKYFGLRQYDTIYDSFLDLLPGGAVHILDLACGPGNVSAYIRCCRPNAHILAADRSEEMLRHFCKRVPVVETLNIDCRDLSNIACKQIASNGSSANLRKLLHRRYQNKLEGCRSKLRVVAG